MSFARMRAEDVSDDAVLGGRLVLRQPRTGHRVGHDAILLAAATDAASGDHAIELGAGVGAAGLALAQRVAGLTVTLVELDSSLAALAQHNAVRNSLGGRVRVAVLDATGSDEAFARKGIVPGAAARVLMNPPFNDPARQNVSPVPERRLAHATAPGTLAQWVERAARLLAPSGVLTLIWRADGMGAVLSALEKGFGGVAVMPVYPRPDSAAIRVLVRAVKGSRAPLALAGGLTLNDANARPSTEAEAILRGGEVLRWPD
ncbi:MAG: methyltransferase [Alphaproteobacteria bacterium]